MLLCAAALLCYCLCGVVIKARFIDSRSDWHPTMEKRKPNLLGWVKSLSGLAQGGKRVGVEPSCTLLLKVQRNGPNILTEGPLFSSLRQAQVS